MKCLALLLLFPCIALSITIQEAIVDGDGSDEDQPLNEGDTLTLNCRVDQEWSICVWSHEIEDQTDSLGNDMKLVCTSQPTHNGDTCTNIGGSDELDDAARRIRAKTSQDSCGLTISRSEAIDGGTWKCSMFSGSDLAGAVSEVDAFVSNQSKIYITEPDLWSDPSEVITYDLSKTNTEIEATCTGYGGNPEPIFHWFVGDDDSDNEITDHKTRKITSSDDLGDYVSEQMTWTPSRADLCNFDATSDSCEDDQLTFSLICKVEQTASSGTYYQNENDQQLVEVVVEVSSASKLVFSSLCLISLALTTVLH